MENRALYEQYHRAVEKGLVASAIALDRGGLAVGLLKSSIGGQLGVCVDIAEVGEKEMNHIERLFSESNGRLLVSVSPDKRAAFLHSLKGSHVACIGVVADTKEILILNGKKEVASLEVRAATSAYRHKFKDS